MIDPFAPIAAGTAPNGKKAPTAGASQWRVQTSAPADKPPPATHPKLGKPSFEWRYRTSSGDLSHVVQRFDTAGGKQIRPLSYCKNLNTGAGEWRYVAPDAPRLLYRLDQLTARTDVPVLVCEGEKATDAGQRLMSDHVAICWLGGSKAATKTDWSPLANRNVVIWPDADEPGEECARVVSKLATEAGAKCVAILNPPAGVKRGWDADDAEAEGWTPARAAEFVAGAQRHGAEESNESNDINKDSERKPRRTPQRDIIFAELEDVTYWHAPNGDAYMNFPWRGYRKNARVGLSDSRRFINQRLVKRTGHSPSPQALEDVLRTIDALAVLDGPERVPAQRVCVQDGKLYLNKGRDGKVYEVDGAGWRLRDMGDLPFVTGSAALELPDAESGYEISILWQYVRSDDAGRMLLVAWIVGALHPFGPYPHLVLSAQQGAGKSFLSWLARALTDPNSVPIRNLPREPRDLFAGANNNHVLAYDNVSKMDPWLSDALCQISTGGGYAARALNKDSEEYVFGGARPAILNGIGDFATRGDFADRAITVRLQAISEDERRPEDELKADLARDLPRIFGAILDGLSAGMRNISKARPSRLPRLADFGKWLYACAPGLGFDSDEWLQLYMDNRKEAADTAFETNPVAVALKALCDSLGFWSGTPTQLLTVLAGYTSESVLRSPSWPKTAQGLGNAIERTAPLLRERGIEVTKKHSGERYVTIARRPSEKQREVDE